MAACGATRGFTADHRWVLPLEAPPGRYAPSRFYRVQEPGAAPPLLPAEGRNTANGTATRPAGRCHITLDTLCGAKQSCRADRFGAMLVYYLLSACTPCWWA